MKIQALAFAAVAATVASFATVGAAEARPGWADRGYSPAIAVVNRRIRNQHRRIRRARRQGRLNWVEARRVRFELSHIRGFRSLYWRDGHINRREFRHLTRLLNRNSRRIRRLANNYRFAPRRQRLSQYNGF